MHSEPENVSNYQASRPRRLRRSSSASRARSSSSRSASSRRRRRRDRRAARRRARRSRPPRSTRRPALSSTSASPCACAERARWDSLGGPLRRSPGQLKIKDETYFAPGRGAESGLTMVLDCSDADADGIDDTRVPSLLHLTRVSALSGSASLKTPQLTFFLLAPSSRADHPRAATRPSRATNRPRSSRNSPRHRPRRTRTRSRHRMTRAPPWRRLQQFRVSRERRRRGARRTSRTLARRPARLRRPPQRASQTFTARRRSS